MMKMRPVILLMLVSASTVNTYGHTMTGSASCAIVQSVFNTGALPPSLVYFTAVCINNKVRLSWNTENEINSSHFIVERSADGRNFTEIKRVNAAGFSSTPKSYEAFDNSPINGINYYRLKQVDIDGKFVYSAVKNLVFNKALIVTITPNPAHDFITINFDKKLSQPCQILILDVNGKVIEKFTTSEQSKQISMMNFPKGIYFIKTIFADNVVTQKIILQ